MTSTEVGRWADRHMFTAEASPAAEGVKAFLLGAPVDPLGQIAACAKMYKGEVVRDLADVTDAERLEYLREIQKTTLKMPMEAVTLHFMVEGVHRGITHQMVRQRTAAFAQESTRFAVKEDLASATALPPSLEGTMSRDEFAAELRSQPGCENYSDTVVEGMMIMAPELQKSRWAWDEAIAHVERAYLQLVNSGIPAEDARGLMPTNITTRLNYITNLRNFYDTMAVRVSDQAQFEWRKVAMAYALAMRKYGEANRYAVWVNPDDIDWGFDIVLSYRDKDDFPTDVDDAVRALVTRSSEWQYVALTQEIKPIEFKIGGPAFGANFDRPSRIGERVAAFAARGVPSSEWTTGSVEHQIPAIHPEEWLLDPASARLTEGTEFDIWGNRVPVGTGAHWRDGQVVAADGSIFELHGDTNASAQPR